MIRTLFFCAAIAAAAPAVALAPAKPKPTQAAPTPTAPPVAQSLSRADFVKQVDARFAAIDTNGDHILSTEEIAAMQAKGLAAARAAEQKQFEDDFKKLDTNGDNSLSLAEFKAAAPALQSRLTPEQTLAAMDPNSDKRVTAEEYRAQSVADFDKADADHNGVLTAQEVAAARRR